MEYSITSIVLLLFCFATAVFIIYRHRTLTKLIPLSHLMAPVVLIAAMAAYRMLDVTVARESLVYHLLMLALAASLFRVALSLTKGESRDQGAA